jgi:hypothetical protein
MPQHHVIGEFSLLLAELETIRGERLAAVYRLRRQVEHSPLPSLPHLALEAPELTDTMCWAALERGDIKGFQRCVSTAVALRRLSRPPPVFCPRPGSAQRHPYRAPGRRLRRRGIPLPPQRASSGVAGSDVRTPRSRRATPLSTAAFATASATDSATRRLNTLGMM